MLDSNDSHEEQNDGDAPAGGENTGETVEGGDILNQQIRHRQLTARVPDSVSRGVFSTGAIVLTGNTEFILDFIVRMSRPFQVAARVVMPHAAFGQFVRVLEDNIRKYESRFGDIPPMPHVDPNAKRPSIQEVYDDLKLPDDLLSGEYANGCIIGHSPGEFVFDFITNFFPRSSVSSRVYLSARQAPQLLKGVSHAVQQLEHRHREIQQKQQNQSGQSEGRADRDSQNQAGDGGRTPNDENTDGPDLYYH